MSLDQYCRVMGAGFSITIQYTFRVCTGQSFFHKQIYQHTLFTSSFLHPLLIKHSHFSHLEALILPYGRVTGGWAKWTTRTFPAAHALWHRWSCTAKGRSKGRGVQVFFTLLVDSTCSSVITLTVSCNTLSTTHWQKSFDRWLTKLESVKSSPA